MHRTNALSQSPFDIHAQRRRRIERFPPEMRELIAALTCCAPQAEDLADSFPALLVALVSDFATPAARSEAFHLILEGQSLKRAAATIGLPLWLKKMPAEAFREPIGPLPSAAPFCTKIGNFIPPKPSNLPDWLEQIQLAEGACDSAFALWVAKHWASVAASRRRFYFLLLASWAWHSQRPGTAGFGLIDRPWSSQIGMRRATEELSNWRRRTDLACLLGDGITRPWLKAGRVDHHDFVPLLTLDDFMSESRSMNNCLDQYADRLSTGLIRVFSIRRGGQRVANVEVGPITAPERLPSIVQLKGPQNRQVSANVWNATQRWLEAQPIEELPNRPGAVRFEPHHKELDALDRSPAHVVAADMQLRAPWSDAFWSPYLEWLPPHLSKEFHATVLAGERRPARPLRHYPIVGAPVAAATGRRHGARTFSSSA